MLKKLGVAVIVLACLMPFTAGAYTIDTLYANPPADFSNDPDGYTSPVAGVDVVNFNGGYAELWSWEGNGWFVKNSVSGHHAAPFGQTHADKTFYLTVPGEFKEGMDSTVTVTHFGTANYLGLWWGSMDAYNTLAFYNNDILVASVTGFDVIADGATLGDQSALGSNHYVNFYGLDPFNKVTFSSSSFAFEVDNVAIGTVPEPTTMLLLGLGLVGLAGAGRRFKK